MQKIAKTATIAVRMPTPAGHAIGGLTIAWLAQSIGRKTSPTLALAGACVATAVLPDVDILLSLHRTYSHSVAAAALAGLVSWLALRGRTRAATLYAVAIAAAYGSHIVLDWLGKDSSPPIGLTALWPISSRFYISGWDLFGEVSRRYWKPDEFIVGNLKAVAWEMLVLGPFAALAYSLSQRTKI